MSDYVCAFTDVLMHSTLTPHLPFQFSLNLCGDPLLTESNSLVGETQLDSHDIPDVWLTNPAGSTNAAGEIVGLCDGSSSPCVSASCCEQFDCLNSPSLNSVSTALSVTGYSSRSGINTPNNFDEMPKCSIASRPLEESIKTPSMKSSRPGRKPLKPQLLRQEEFLQTFGSDDDSGFYVPSPLKQTDENDWFAMDNSITATSMATSESCKREQTLQKFMKPFTGHSEKRIVATLEDAVDSPCVSVSTPLDCCFYFRDPFQI